MEVEDEPDQRGRLMGTDVPMTDVSRKGLRRQLGLIDAMILSVGIIGPTASIALNGSLAASIAGTAVPLAFLGAFITIVLIAYSFVAFSRRYAHAGSVYKFNGMAFGPRFGFLSAWALLLTYSAFVIGSCVEVGLFFQTFLSLFGATINWIIPALIAAVIAWVLAHRQVRLSTRTTIVLEGLSVTAILIVTLIILARGGAHGLSAKPFEIPTQGLSAVALASIFAFLSFAGFEGAATLGEETSNPTKAIPRALWASVFFIGSFYVLVVYAQSVGFGLDAKGIQAFGTSSAPAMDLAKMYAGTTLAVVISLGATVSAFAAALSQVVASSRLLYALGRDGFGPAALGRTHPKHGSPYIANAVVVVAAIVIMLALSGQTGFNAFAWAGTVGVLALLLVYMATQVAAIWLFRRNGAWRALQPLIPLAAMVLLGYCIYSNVYPVPPAPFNYLPYGVLAWIIVGVVIVLAVPGLAEKLGRSFTERGVGNRAPR